MLTNTPYGCRNILPELRAGSKKSLTADYADDRRLIFSFRVFRVFRGYVLFFFVTTKGTKFAKVYFNAEMRRFAEVRREETK